MDMPGADPGVTGFGVNPQLAPAGRLEAAQLRLTRLLNPLVAATVIVDVPDCPADEMLTGVPPTEKSAVATNPGHEVTRVSALTEPSPVTRSYPGPALNPIVVVPDGQFGVPVVQGTLLSPVVMS